VTADLISRAPRSGVCFGRKHRLPLVSRAPVAAVPASDTEPATGCIGVKPPASPLRRREAPPLSAQAPPEHEIGAAAADAEAEVARLLLRLGDTTTSEAATTGRCSSRPLRAARCVSRARLPPTPRVSRLASASRRARARARARRAGIASRQ
jgi:hypothetical protein